MIIGIGLDMIEVERVKEKIQKEQGFREMVFAAAEIEYCERKTNSYEHYAARFAAKEALFKAIGTGWTNGTSYNEVVILNNESGKPEISFIGETANTLQHLELSKIKISLSHLKNTAAAVVAIED
jgi:holo-[acyl-carrier protein] synthase